MVLSRDRFLTGGGGVFWLWCGRRVSQKLYVGVAVSVGSGLACINRVYSSCRTHGITNFSYPACQRPLRSCVINNCTAPCHTRCFAQPTATCQASNYEAQLTATRNQVLEGEGGEEGTREGSVSASTHEAEVERLKALIEDLGTWLGYHCSNT